MSYSNEDPAKNKSYKRPFGLSFILHVIIILMLLFSLHWSHQPAVLQVGNDKTEVIEAVSMDGDQIAKEAARIQQDNSEKKKVEEAEKQAEEERLEKLHEEAAKQEEALKQEEQQQQETKKLEQLKKQQEAEKQKEAIAEEKALQEKQLQETKRLEEEKKIAEEKALLKAKAEAKAKADEKAKADAKAKAIEKAKAVEKAKKDAKAKADALAKAKAVAAAKAKAAADAKAKAAAAAKAKADATAKANAAAVKAKQDADARRAQISHMQGEVNRYKVLITQAIRNKWIVPANVKAGLYSQFEIRLAPGGAVLSVRLLKSSGDTVLDRSAENAIYKASPLPVPMDPGMFEMFRLINLKVTPDANVAAVIN